MRPPNGEDLFKKPSDCRWVKLLAGLMHHRASSLAYLVLQAGLAETTTGDDGIAANILTAIADRVEVSLGGNSGTEPPTESPGMIQTLDPVPKLSLITSVPKDHINPAAKETSSCTIPLSLHH